MTLAGPVEHCGESPDPQTLDLNCDADLDQAYEMELRDSAEYYRWQAKVRAHDSAALLALVRRLMGE